MSAPMGKEKGRTSLQKKIMAAVYELSSVGVLCSEDGLVHLLQGSLEANDYASFIGFSSLSSLSSRRGKASINKLIEHNVLFSSYSSKGKDYFLSLNPEYEEEAKRCLGWLSTKTKKLKTRKVEFIER